MFKYFTSMFKRYIRYLPGSRFIFCDVLSLSGMSFGMSNGGLIKIVGKYPLLFFVLGDLYVIAVLSFINVWWNLSLKLSGTGNSHWLWDVRIMKLWTQDVSICNCGFVSISCFGSVTISSEEMFHVFSSFAIRCIHMYDRYVFFVNQPFYYYVWVFIPGNFFSLKFTFSDMICNYIRFL